MRGGQHPLQTSPRGARACAEINKRGGNMNRRELITASLSAATAAAAATAASAAAPTTAAVTIYVSPTGSDTNSGSKDSPIATVFEAARRVNADTGTGPVTVILTEGLHALHKETQFKPPGRQFTKTARLTIRAEVLPDDPAWHAGRMPTIVPTMPLLPAWNGRPINSGGATNGLNIETSYVTIQGLKFLGYSAVEEARVGQINRIYPIGRFGQTLDDLEISQCFFGGDRFTAPNHCPIIANGTGMNIHHTIFFNTKLTAVYWTQGSTGHSMHHCLMYGCYEGGPWTAHIANDFDFHNNIVAHSLNAWVQQVLGNVDPDAIRPAGAGGPPGGARPPGAPGAAGAPPAGPPRRVPLPTDGQYKIRDSLFAHNERLAVSGTGANLGFRNIEPDFLEMINTTVTDEPLLLNMDQFSRRYLHPLPGTLGAATGAGLFMKT
jgi:hypothetical protein